MSDRRHIVHSSQAAGPPSPLPRPVRFLGPPLPADYGHLEAQRNRHRERHASARARRPVISVGNLSAGGTGKTPVVSWLAGRLLAAGHRPAIAMRGYKARRGRKSDEQLEHEARLPGVPVLADPDRRAAIEACLAQHEEIDVILLDDGFQHRQLHRDLDIVLVDALRSPFDDALLPRGYLREPVAGLARAHVVALTRSDLVTEGTLASLRSDISQLVGTPPHVEFRSAWARIDSSDADEPREINWLKGRSFIALCGIGHPAAFIAMAQRAGARLVQTIIRRDHTTYRHRFLADLARRAGGTDGVLTTAKDWVKIEPLLRQHRIRLAVHRPYLEFDVVRGGDWLIERIEAIIEQRTEQRTAPRTEHRT